MKKLLSLTCALTLLTACSHYAADVDEAAQKRAENRTEIREEIGCQFANDHESYRKCLIATYESSKPKTFTTTTATDGQPVAVVSKGELKPTNTALLNATSATPCMYTKQEMYETQVPAQPCTTCAPIQVEAPKVVTVTTTETVQEKPVEVVPAPTPLPEKTWWETYQETKPEEKPAVKCPCEDPNDPCPQCVSK